MSGPLTSIANASTSALKERNDFLIICAALIAIVAMKAIDVFGPQKACETQTIEVTK